MQVSAGFDGRFDTIAALFEEAFTASEGADEGRLIGNLASDLMTTTPPQDLYVFCAEDGGTLVGCILFTRMRYDADDRVVFLLSPVAVAPSRQGEGIGQRLIAHGLNVLRADGIQVAITYGNPDFYGRVGFAPMSTEFAAAPHALQFPHGWIGQSLTDAPLTPLRGQSRCASALNDPALW